MPKKIEISHRTIVFTVLFLAFLWFLLSIRDIIFLVFVSTLVMTILNPTVSKLNRYKIPRAASVLIVYISVLALVIFTVAAIIPPLVEQTSNFASSLPRYLRELKIPVFLIDSATAELTSQLGQLPGQ